MVSCDQKKSSAEKIIEKTIEKAGGEKYKNAEITFEFRDTQYKSTRKNGEFRLERFITDSTGTTYHDVLNNEGFTRFSKKEEVKVNDSMKTLYSNSVNAVHYFVQLPFGLNDDAVKKKLLGKDSIGDSEYYEIKVSFEASEEVTDPEDVYVYWINTEKYTVDYFAYSFKEDGGGIRFRQAINPRIINGIRFVDYENYKTEKLETPLEQMDELFEAGELELFSVIENEDIEVQLLE